MESVGKLIGAQSQMDSSERSKFIANLLDKENINPKEYFFDKPQYDEPVYIDPKPILGKYGVQKRQQHITFEWIIDNNNFNECDRESYRKAYLYGKEIYNHINDGQGLVLKGLVGTGKTTLAIAIMRKAVEQGIRCLFVNNISLNDKLLNLLNSDRKELANYDHLLRTVPLLVIDDFGAESDRNNHSWLVEKMESIIGERYDRMLPVVITTNLSHEALVERYNTRIYDRLRETCGVLKFKGQSLRVNKEENNER